MKNFENKTPLVSIIVPCYNHEKYVQECIESIINQEYKNIELIIIDDGSVDASVKKINEIKEKCRIRFSNFIFLVQKNKGLCRTLNEALNNVSGKYFGVIASDDKLLKDKISKQVNFLESNSNIAGCFGGVNIIDKESSFKRNICKKPRLYNFDDVFLRRAYLPAPTALLRTKSVVEVGGYDEKLKVEDFDLWLKLTSKGYKLYNVGETMSEYRIHENNSTKRVDAIWADVFTILDKYKYHPKYKLAKGSSLIVKSKNENIKKINRIFLLLEAVRYNLRFIISLGWYKALIKVLIN